MMHPANTRAAWAAVWICMIPAAIALADEDDRAKRLRQLESQIRFSESSLLSLRETFDRISREYETASFLESRSRKDMEKADKQLGDASVTLTEARRSERQIFHALRRQLDESPKVLEQMDLIRQAQSQQRDLREQLLKPLKATAEYKAAAAEAERADAEYQAAAEAQPRDPQRLAAARDRVSEKSRAVREMEQRVLEKDERYVAMEDRLIEHRAQLQHVRRGIEDAIRVDENRIAAVQAIKDAEVTLRDAKKNHAQIAKEAKGVEQQFRTVESRYNLSGTQLQSAEEGLARLHAEYRRLQVPVVVPSP